MMFMERFARGKKWIVLAAVISCVAAFPSRAMAQCEDPASATSSLTQMVQDNIRHINNFINQEYNFIDEDLSTTAVDEVASRFDEFEDTVYPFMNDWWENRFEPAMKEQTKQLSMAQVDQSRQLGAILDSTATLESKRNSEKMELEAHRRYEPSPQSCQVDTVGPSQTKTSRLARKLARGFQQDELPRGLNATGSPSANGRGSERKAQWDDFVARYCDFDHGDQGCTANGTMPGKHADLPGLLWGEKQTIDMTNADTRKLVTDVQSYLINPASLDPLSPVVINTPAGKENFLMRRSRQARLNTVYTAIGQMIGERVGNPTPAGGGATNTNVNTQDMFTATGVAPANASPTPSYREMQDAMTRARYYNPDYIVKMMQSPEQVVREQGSINAMRLQQLNDLYKRQEEMVAMEAASYASRLDKRVPSSFPTAGRN